MGSKAVGWPAQNSSIILVVDVVYAFNKIAKKYRPSDLM